MSIFKACDIRGEFGAELTEDHARALGAALVAVARPDRVIVGGDGRLSTPALKAALIDALTQSGVTVLDIGIVPTPAFYYARRLLGVNAGVMVTASHNPAPDNGFKVTIGDLPITEAEITALRQHMDASTPPALGAGGPAGGRVVPTPILDPYARFTAEVAGPDADGGGETVVLDCANGMLGPVAPRVFEQLGWDVAPLFADVDGSFPNHPPNPAVAANLEALRTEVVRHRALLGVAYDGDGDRTMFVDERGNVVTCDEAIVLFARAAVRLHPGAKVVYDQKCSDVVREETLRAGGVPRIERSGYTFIKTTLLTEGAAYAGEASGHHFFADIDGDDGLLASLRMAAIVRACGRTFSELVAGIPRYCITPDLRLPVEPGETDAILRDLRRNLRERADLSEMDGIRAQFDDGWGLARPSVTEPVITVRLEGHTWEALRRVKDEFERAAPALAGRL